MRPAERQRDRAIGPIAGQYQGQGVLHLQQDRSHLRLRLPTELIPAILPLAEQAHKDGIKMMYQNVPVPTVTAAFGGGYVADLVGLTSQAEERMVANADPYFVAKLASIEVFGVHQSR